MNKIPIIHSNSLINKEEFIDFFLDKPIISSKIPTIDIEETYRSYNINIYFFSYKNHFLKMHYKNNFLVLEMHKINSDLDKSLKRIFYLKDINLSKIFLYDYRYKIKFIIPKF